MLLYICTYKLVLNSFKIVFRLFFNNVYFVLVSFAPNLFKYCTRSRTIRKSFLISYFYFNYFRFIFVSLKASKVL